MLLTACCWLVVRNFLGIVFVYIYISFRLHILTYRTVCVLDGLEEFRRFGKTGHVTCPLPEHEHVPHV